MIKFGISVFDFINVLKAKEVKIFSIKMIIYDLNSLFSPFYKFSLYLKFSQRFFVRMIIEATLINNFDITLLIE